MKHGSVWIRSKAFIKKEVQSLVERAKSEQAQRTEADKDLAQQLKEFGQQSKEYEQGNGKTRQ